MAEEVEFNREGLHRGDEKGRGRGKRKKNKRKEITATN